MTVDFRYRIEEWLAVLAADAEKQLQAVGDLPEELRLAWEDLYSAIDERGAAANPAGIAQFSATERAALKRFDDYLWSLPPEPDPMWHRNALTDAPWPDIRSWALETLGQLRTRRGE